MVEVLFDVFACVVIVLFIIAAIVMSVILIGLCVRIAFMIRSEWSARYNKKHTDEVKEFFKKINDDEK